MNFSDFDIQMATNSSGQRCMQVVGISGDGLKTVVKEYDAIEFFTKEQAKAFAAPAPGDPNIGLKLGGAFIVGLIVGGFIVYVALNRQTILPQIFSAPAGAVHYSAPQPPAPQVVYVESPRRPEYDPNTIPLHESLVMRDYDRLFRYNEQLEDMEF